MLRCVFFVAPIFMLISAASAQRGAAKGEWRSYAADAGFTRYSPLDQIDSGNVADLALAWRWDCAAAAILKQAQGMRIGYFKNTPLMIDGFLYVTTPMNHVAALLAYALPK
jgi:glucose dehydrogenase